MEKSYFKLKIIIIFFIPTIALIYFSSAFIQTKFILLDESKVYKLSAEVTNSLSKLLHNLQIERGLSSGYIADSNSLIEKSKLIEHHKLTDATFKKFLYFVELNSEAKDMILKKVGIKSKPLSLHIVKEIKGISTTRDSVLNHSIDFNTEIDYYNKTNASILKLIALLENVLKVQSDDSHALYTLQKLKESAGQERAYTYNQLMSNKFQTKQIAIIKALQKQQNDSIKQFALISSIDNQKIYNSLHVTREDVSIYKFRKRFLDNSLDSSSSKEWFTLSTARIDTLEKISSAILNRYISKADIVHTEATNALFITAILWTTMLLSLGVLAYILKNLIKKQEEFIESLRILSYTFDSHEAMTITDVDGTILKVNNAFSRITGYSSQEVVGKNPRVLKSMKHSDDYYKSMWHELSTVGKWTKEIYNKRKNNEIYPERLSITAIKNEEGETTNYIAQFLDLTDLKKAEEEAFHQANHDFLTNLTNRKYLMQRLTEERAKGMRHDFLHAFIFIDIDGFKKVNDNYGHEVGDKLLIKISNRLKSIFRQEDIVARIGGDEFAIIILNLDKEVSKASKDVKDISLKIIQRLNQPFNIDQHTVGIGASIGIKFFPNNARDVEDDIVLHADKAMYQAKSQGKNRYVFFNKEIEDELKNFQILENELKIASRENQFIFHYQPKVCITSGKIIGAEALVRWQHPTKGLLYPDSFLKIVSETGMISEITTKALHNVCNFFNKHTEFDGVISINIASNELLIPNFTKNIISIIDSYNINPSKIELEIVEDELIDDFDAIIVKMKELKEFGVRFAIDDFGTGYSSLSYLQKLPIDALKIDRSFFQDFDKGSNKELIKLVIDIANSFNLDSIVEGVETTEQLDFIKGCNAKQYQGYLFSKPIDEDSFEKLLKD